MSGNLLGGHQVEKFISLPHPPKNLHRIGGREGSSRRDREGIPDLKSRGVCWEVAVAGGAGQRRGRQPGLLSSRCRRSLNALSSLLNPIAPDFIYDYFRAHLYFSPAKNWLLRSAG